MADSAEAEALKILIVGAGIGGLTAALGLRRNGHKVTVYERSRFAADLGAAVILAPNAAGILKRLGVDPEKDGAVPRQWHTEYTDSGRLLSSGNISLTAGLWQHRGLLCHRVSVHRLLRDAATSQDGFGPPVEICLALAVSDVNLESTTLHLEDGSVVSGDFIVGADGVKSITRTKIFDTKPFPSGKNAFRFMLERCKALDSPLLEDLQLREGEFSIWIGKDRRVWLYTTQHNELLNFVCMYPDTLEDVTDSRDVYGENNDKMNHKANMMDIFKNFDPRILAVMDLAEPSTVKNWQLLDMDPGPTRVSGNLCLLGDAALTFLPHIGQGAASAIEDAASLTALFPAATLRKDIPERLQLYNEIRKDRPEKIHSISRLLGQDLEPGTDQAQSYQAKSAKEYFQFVFSHDEYDSTTQKLREFLYKKAQPRWSMPTAFGPNPGSTQTFYGNPEPTLGSCISVKFKTSRTLLQNLIPENSFVFRGPGSVAYASLEYVQFCNVSWLGGRGYNQLSFYIYDIECTAAPFKGISGSFLPLLFTDSAEVLVAERENLGIPAVYCQLSSRVNESTSIQASWNGTTFVDIGLSDLQSPPRDALLKPIPEDNVFVHRWFPPVPNASLEKVTGQLVRIPVKDRPSEVATEGAKTGTKASIEYMPHDPTTLPTLHHIITRLAELPIYEIVATAARPDVTLLDYENALASSWTQPT